VLKKAMTGQNMMSQPMTSIKTDNPRLQDEDPQWGKASHLSTQKEAKTKSVIMT
jgi:hypothetical protein